jgi:PAS domain S-box-containing protein
MKYLNKPGIREYLLAVGVTQVALLARFGLDPLLDNHLPYVTFFAAVAVTTYYGGLGASLTAVVLGGVLSQWFFLPPRYSLAVSESAQLVGYAIYFLVSLTFVGFGQALRRARQDAETTAGRLRREADHRREAEQALRDRQRQLQLITDTAPVAIAHCDTEGRYRLVNQAYAERFGLRPEECVGKTMAEILGPDTFAARREYIDAVLQGERVAFEAEGPSAEGRRWWHGIYVPELRPDGTVNGLVAVISDVTAYREAQESLQRQLDLTDTITTNSTQALFMIDTQGYCTFMNPPAEAIFGFSFDEMRRRPLHEMIHHHHPDGRPYPMADCPIDRALPDNFDVREHEDAFIRKNGAWVPVLVAASPIFKDGRPVSTVIEVRDITERKQADTALRESEERLRSFAGQLELLVDERTTALVQSQEQLRTLATELNLTEQRERKRLAMELHDHLAQLLVLSKLRLSQAKHMPDLTSKCLALLSEADEVLTQALNYTRTLVAELTPPVLHDFGLPTALRWLGEQMQRRHRLAVAVQGLEEALPLPEDQAVLLFQSVRELLINVSKHSHAAQATVSIEQRRGELCIEVRDEGQGYDPASQAAGAAQATTTDSSKFGLFSIRERMRALGGQFHLESSPGQGTTARLTMPLSGGAAPTPPAVSAPRSAPRRKALRVAPHGSPGPHGVRVLLVDDHAMVRQGLRSILDSYADIKVVGEAWDGQEAMAACERLRPAVVVMDINMPKKNGIEATAAIKRHAPETIVIGLSVNAGEESRQAMKDAGAALLLTKEAAVEQLYTAIQQAVRESGRSKGKRNQTDQLRGNQHDTL